MIPRLAAAIGLCLMAAGCGGKHGLASGLHRVTGTVVVKDRRDLPRLRECTVAARSVADPAVEARGAIDDVDGTFELSTTRKDGDRFVVLEGVPAGEYVARIEGLTVRAIPARYTDFAKSGLKFTVGPGENAVTLEVSLR